MVLISKPVLVIMAAGLGSRYGGLKQIAPVDDAGHILIDFALYDAVRAGFEKVVFVIKPEMENEFKNVIGKRIEGKIEAHYAFQTLDALPTGFAVPAGRVKPWGTAHAVLSAKPFVDGNFAAINADDFYGANAFTAIYDFLQNKAGAHSHAMVGYKIGNTITEHGSVARGVCEIDARENLVEIIERTHIEARPNGAAYSEDGGKTFTFLPFDTTVSLNLWGFGLEFMLKIEDGFESFLKDNLPVNPLKCEYFLPFVANRLLAEGKSEIKTLPTQDKWYGVTYTEDMPVLRNAIARMKSGGIYPEDLWGGGI